MKAELSFVMDEILHGDDTVSAVRLVMHLNSLMNPFKTGFGRFDHIY